MIFPAQGNDKSTGSFQYFQEVQPYSCSFVEMHELQTADFIGYATSIHKHMDILGNKDDAKISCAQISCRVN